MEELTGWKSMDFWAKKAADRLEVGTRTSFSREKRSSRRSYFNNEGIPALCGLSFLFLVTAPASVRASSGNA